MSSMHTFQRMIDTMFPSWSQKKCCLLVINELQGQIDALDDKLVHGKPFDAPKQEFYDMVSCLKEKESYLKTSMQKKWIWVNSPPMINIVY